MATATTLKNGKKERYKTFIIRKSGSKDCVISFRLFEKLGIRILAHEPSSRRRSDVANCAFKTLNDFYDDEFDSGQDFNEEDYNYPYFSTRQLGSIGHFLRKSVLKHRWNEAAKLTQLLCHPGIMLYRSTIISACYLLLINHRKSNAFLLEDFVSECTQYDLTEEVEKFIRIIFAIRDTPLSMLHPGKHESGRKTCKVVNDDSFENF